MKSLKTHLSLLAVAALLCSASQASATIWYLEAFLDGAQETPPNASPGTGYGTVTLDDVTGQVTASGTFSGLIAAANNAHIHGLAGPGASAGPILNLTFDAATSGTFSGSGTLSASQVAGMLNGLTYFNIHSGTYPGGEIRGQITVVPEPSALAVLGLGALVCFRRMKPRFC
jgi:hypothetical protein